MYHERKHLAASTNLLLHQKARCQCSAKHRLKVYARHEQDLAIYVSYCGYSDDSKVVSPLSADFTDSLCILTRLRSIMAAYADFF